MSCSQDEVVLANSKIGDITRNDFYTWLEAKKINKESVLGEKKRQIQLLKSMGLERFILDKTGKEGFDKSRDILILKERIRESVLNKYFIKTLTEMTTYREPVVRVSYILLSMDLFKPDPDNKGKRKRLEPQEVALKNGELLAKAKEIIKKLDAGEGFEKLAAIYSDDSTKKNDGDFGYMFKDMMPTYFSEAAFKLDKGEYTKTPVMTPKGIYIIKVTDKAVLTEKNIDKIIEDKEQCDRIKSLLVLRYKNDYIAALEKADDVELLKKKEKINNTDSLFRVGSKEYIAADIEKLIESRLTQEELDKINKDIIFSDKSKMRFAESYYKFLLRSRAAKRLGVDTRSDYLKELKEREINMLMGEYIGAQLSAKVIISDQEILEEYESKKETKYSDKVLESGVVVDKPVPLDIVRDEIVDELKQKILQERGQLEREKLLDLYDLKINETALQGS